MLMNVVSSFISLPFLFNIGWKPSPPTSSMAPSSPHSSRSPGEPLRQGQSKTVGAQGPWELAEVAHTAHYPEGHQTFKDLCVQESISHLFPCTRMRGRCWGSS